MPPHTDAWQNGSGSELEGAVGHEQLAQREPKREMGKSPLLVSGPSKWFGSFVLVSFGHGPEGGSNCRRGDGSIKHSGSAAKATAT